MLNGDGTVNARHAAGQGPQDVAFDRAGNTWVTAFHDGKVHKLSPTGQSLGVYETGYRPMGVAVDSAGHVWVANMGGGTVTALSAAGAVLGTYDAGQVPSDLAFDGAGNLWVLNSGYLERGEDREKVTIQTGVTKLSPTGQKLGEFAVIGARALAISATGIWVAGANLDGAAAPENQGRLTRLALDGAVASRYELAALPNPFGLAVDPRGRLWLSAASGEVLVLNGTGQITARRPVGAFPHGIAFDAQGRAWVSNRHSQSVSRVSVP
ncbi:Virginiamycin B lyase [compost metagenome]